MTLMQRRRALMEVKKDSYPEQEIGYNLLVDVQNFEMVEKNNPTSVRDKRWAATADFIPINPNYTYKVGRQNTQYFAYCYDSKKSYISRVDTSIWGGYYSDFPHGTVYVKVGWGYTGYTIESFKASIDKAGAYDQSKGTFFSRYS